MAPVSLLFASPSVRTSSSRRNSCRAQSEGWMRHSPPSSAETRRIVHPGPSRKHQCSTGGVAFAAVTLTYHTATSKPSWPVTCSLAWFSAPGRCLRWTNLSIGSSLASSRACSPRKKARRCPMNEHAKITASHLSRQAIVYLRQSTAAQVEHNRESTERQYALSCHNHAYSEAVGWLGLIDPARALRAEATTMR